MSADEQNPRKVGYRTPPRSGQFQKGSSGNPQGRPRKRRDEPALPEDRDPTLREVIGAETNRKIAITDHQGRHTISAKQAMLRAMFTTGVKGGINAQRTFLRITTKAEARERKEKERRFKYWSDYKDDCEETNKKRLAQGKRPAKFLPHPDDIELNWATSEVRLTGPINEEHQAAAVPVVKLQDLAYEMAIYHNELSHMCDEDGRITQMGVYIGLYLRCQHLLWPRLRKPPAAYHKAMMQRVTWRDDEWESKLKPRCKALGLPFLPRKKNAAPLMVPLAKLGIRKPIQTPPARLTPRPRRRRRA